MITVIVCDPLALPTTVFHRFYCARRVLYVIETTLLAGFESYSLRHCLHLLVLSAGDTYTDTGIRRVSPHGPRELNVTKVIQARCAMLAALLVNFTLRVELCGIDSGNARIFPAWAKTASGPAGVQFAWVGDAVPGDNSVIAM